MAPAEPFLVGLRLKDRLCVIDGDGQETLGKCTQLLRAGARVHVVHPTSNPELSKLAAESRITWHPRELADADLSGAFLVLTTVKDPARARWLSAASRARGFLLGCLDLVDAGDLVQVAVARTGTLQFGISTGGVAPALASRIRALLEPQLGEDLARFVRAVGAHRDAAPPGSRRALMARLLEGFSLELRYVLPPLDETPPPVNRS